MKIGSAVELCGRNPLTAIILCQQSRSGVSVKGGTCEYGERAGTHTSPGGQIKTAEGSTAAGVAAEDFGWGPITLAKVEAGEIGEETLKQWLHAAITRSEARALFELDVDA
jgi:hypothetical protein